jgi:hypothetical protein
MNLRNSATVLHSDFSYPSLVNPLVKGAYRKMLLRPVALLRTTAWNPRFSSPTCQSTTVAAPWPAFSPTRLRPPRLRPAPVNATWANVARWGATCADVAIPTNPSLFGPNARTATDTNRCNE